MLNFMAWSEYMAGIRAKLGADLLLTPAAGVALFDPQGRVLLGRHSDDVRWGTPGGGMDPGETPRQAACRELLEETGLQAIGIELIDAFGGADFEVVHTTGARTAYVVVLYGAKTWTGDVELQPDELTEVGWFGRHQTGALDLPPDMHRMLPAAFFWYEASR